MLSISEAWSMLDSAEEICSASEIEQTLGRMATEITHSLGNVHPLILSVMGGAVIFTGQLLPLLRFPLDFDYIHASRYGAELQGTALEWKVMPKESVSGRSVLVLDDILDQGYTLAAVRDKVLAMGARSFHSAVFADKKIISTKPIQADFVGLSVPDRYVFGFGMDIKGAWRNLPAIYALK